MPAKKVQLSFGDISKTLSERLKTAAVRPNVYGYKPHAKQEKFHASQSKGRLYIGGNRSGKTTGAIIEDIWWLTRKHPFRSVPDRPISGRIIGVDFRDGIGKILKPEMARWLPMSELKGGSWSTAFSNELQTLTLENGSFVDFMSYEQDLEKFAGVSKDFIHYDEEPPEDIFLENKTRLIDTGGSWWISMTPVEGMCVDEQTQLLSQRGWLWWDELLPTDIILTHQGWKRLESFYVNEDYEGPTHTFGGLNAAATKDHKWMTQRGLISESEIKHEDKIKITVDIDNLYPSQYSKEFVELIGWVIGDGTIPKDSTTKVNIYQSEWVYPQKCQRIKDLIEFCGGTYWQRERYEGDGNLVIGINGDLGRDIRRIVGMSKSLSPEWIASLNKDLLLALEKGLVESDGTIKASGTREITTIRRDHADMYEMVGVLAGHRVTTGTYDYEGGLFYKVRYWAKEQCPRGTNRKEKQYKGLVWCPHTEAGTFIARRNGSIYLTGNTWVYDDIYMKGKNDPTANISVIEVEMTENPYLNTSEVDEFMAGLSHDDLTARVKGKFIQVGGLVYKHFDPEIHVVNPMIPPKNWEWYASMDHGFNNPTAWLWHAVSPDGKVITFAEHYEAEQTVEYHAGVVHTRNGAFGRVPDIYVGDPAIAQRQAITGVSIQQAYSELGIGIALGNNDVLAGVNKVSTYLQKDADDIPNWLITRNCINLIGEMQRLRWKTWASKRIAQQNNNHDAIHKKNDHACDSSRYFFTMMPDLKPAKLLPAGKPIGMEDSSRSVPAEGRYDEMLIESLKNSKNPNTQWTKTENIDETVGMW